MSLHLAYQLTPTLAGLLDAWDAGIADEGPLVRHRWTDLALWPAARSATVAGSTGIEGNRLPITAVDAVLAGQPSMGSTADIRDVLNYNAALDLANRVAVRGDFEWSQELLRRLNATVLAGLEDDEHGEYRTLPVMVGSVFEPPEAARVPGYVRELVDWLGTDDGTLHTLVFAGLTHLNVVSIHPWRNGNGRTARVAGSLALMRRGIAAPELVNVESWIRAHPADYAAVLQETHGPDYRPDEHSATPFLEYFARISVDRLGLRSRLLAAARGDVGTLVFALGARGEPIDWAPILLAAAIGPVRTTTMAQRLGLSPSRVRALLGAMTASGWLVAEGDRRGRSLRAGRVLLELGLRAPGVMDRLRAGTA
jgi:Fic/DOC family